MPLESALSRRLRSLVALAILLPLGLLWRLAPLHLPAFTFKYGGSALWAMAVYAVIALLMPRSRPRILAAVACLVATAVECFKLVYWPPLDQFRSTLTGKLLLGRYFTVDALLAYWLAIAFSALLDTLWIRRSRPLAA